ncbi:hypothetical protein GUJ93_ZPchr0002g25496 [Zizania palustris]|uniref:Uncharacterized protein n=1 Tax=Zizania palustris TaxID=103762 RepID=A0A8J5VQK9_ZIZPA|nr:hypothetical protein GUJ93_ZPchr0002g25496 [Zizania palustris]
MKAEVARATDAAKVEASRATEVQEKQASKVEKVWKELRDSEENSSKLSAKNAKLLSARRICDGGNFERLGVIFMSLGGPSYSCRAGL